MTHNIATYEITLLRTSLQQALKGRLPEGAEYSQWDSAARDAVEKLNQYKEHVSSFRCQWQWRREGVDSSHPSPPQLAGRWNIGPVEDIDIHRLVEEAIHVLFTKPDKQFE